MQSKRRKFLRNSLMSAAGISALPSFENLMAATGRTRFTKSNAAIKKHYKPENKIRFSVIGLNHGHIYSQVAALLEGGGEFVSVYAKEPELLETFKKRYPDVKSAASEKEILEDESIQLIASASIPNERAPLGIRAMRMGKDFMADKPGITTLDQLKEVKKVQKETGRIYSIMYSERLNNRASIYAGNLVQEGAIGKVVQTLLLGPHRMRAETRPEWFWDPEKFGGILCDIGSHNVDQFLFYTGSTKADIIASQVGNINNSQYPSFQDFGDMHLTGDKGTGYIRIDWFTPDGLDSWGDGKLIILGTEGFIEVRKNIDISGRDGGNHLFIVDNKETKYIDCKEVPKPYGMQLVNDVVNRTETAMSQEHCFLATELALIAQKNAKWLSF